MHIALCKFFPLHRLQKCDGCAIYGQPPTAAIESWKVQRKLLLLIDPLHGIVEIPRAEGPGIVNSSLSGGHQNDRNGGTDGPHVNDSLRPWHCRNPTGLRPLGSENPPKVAGVTKAGMEAKGRNVRPSGAHHDGNIF